MPLEDLLRIRDRIREGSYRPIMYVMSEDQMNQIEEWEKMTPEEREAHYKREREKWIAEAAEGVVSAVCRVVDSRACSPQVSKACEDKLRGALIEFAETIRRKTIEDVSYEDQ